MALVIPQLRLVTVSHHLLLARDSGTTIQMIAQVVILSTQDLIVIFLARLPLTLPTLLAVDTVNVLIRCYHHSSSTLRHVVVKQDIAVSIALRLVLRVCNVLQVNSDQDARNSAQVMQQMNSCLFQFVVVTVFAAKVSLELDCVIATLQHTAVIIVPSHVRLLLSTVWFALAVALVLFFLTLLPLALVKMASLDQIVVWSVLLQVETRKFVVARLKESATRRLVFANVQLVITVLRATTLALPLSLQPELPSPLQIRVMVTVFVSSQIQLLSSALWLRVLVSPTRLTVFGVLDPVALLHSLLALVAKSVTVAQIVLSSVRFLSWTVYLATALVEVIAILLPLLAHVQRHQRVDIGEVALLVTSARKDITDLVVSIAVLESVDFQAAIWFLLLLLHLLQAVSTLAVRVMVFVVMVYLEPVVALASTTRLLDSGMSLLDVQPVWVDFTAVIVTRPVLFLSGSTLLGVVLEEETAALHQRVVELFALVSSPHPLLLIAILTTLLELHVMSVLLAGLVCIVINLVLEFHSVKLFVVDMVYVMTTSTVQVCANVSLVMLQVIALTNAKEE
jgi:hypothetical protein